MSKPSASPRLSPVLVPVLAGATLLAAAPAQAEIFFRPFGGVYVERYYEPLPPGGYYAEPLYPQPVPPAPVYRAPARFPFADVEPMLRSMGMRSVGRVRVDGNTYVVDATDSSGTRVRVRIDAFDGRILAVLPTGAPPVARQAPAAPPRTAVAPLPPRKPPEIAAMSVPAPPPVTDPDAPVPAALPPDAAGATPASPSAAPEPATPATPAAPESTAVRVIPGIATPPGTAPQPAEQAATPAPTVEAARAADAPPSESAAEAPSSTGTGTGTGSTTPAGTASVVARGTSGKPPAPAD